MKNNKIRVDKGVFETMSNSDSDANTNADLTKICKLCVICCTKAKKPKALDPCGHIFCRKCIKKWLKQNITCPVCRQITTNKLTVTKLIQHYQEKLVDNYDMFSTQVSTYLSHNKKSYGTNFDVKMVVYGTIAVMKDLMKDLSKLNSIINEFLEDFMYGIDHYTFEQLTVFIDKNIPECVLSKDHIATVLNNMKCMSEYTANVSDDYKDVKESLKVLLTELYHDATLHMQYVKSCQNYFVTNRKALNKMISKKVKYE